MENYGYQQYERPDLEAQIGSNKESTIEKYLKQKKSYLKESIKENRYK